MSRQEDRLMGELENTSSRLSVLLSLHAKSEEEHQQTLEEIERNTRQLQNEFMELQQSEYSSDAAIAKARRVIEENVKKYSSGLSERVLEQRPDDQVFLLRPGVPTKIRMNPTYLDGIWHFMVASEDMKLGKGYALDMLREINKDGKQRPEEIIEIDGNSWNQIGILEEFDRLVGNIVIVQNVSMLTEKSLREFEMVLGDNEKSFLVVFIDSIENLARIFNRHRRFLDTFSAQFTARCYNEAEMMDYAVRYLHQNGYTLEQASKHQLYKEIRRMPLVDSDGQRKQLLNRLEEVMDNAESRSMKTVLRNLFGPKTDEEGRKILKVEDF